MGFIPTLLKPNRLTSTNCVQVTLTNSLKGLINKPLHFLVLQQCFNVATVSSSILIFHLYLLFILPKKGLDFS